jgi:hypothetical protein
LSARQILVYVQAIPISVPSSARRFQDLETSEFIMAQSSRSALSFARLLDFHEIVAVGFSPVLREAIARGATSCFSIPLCDDPLEQASFFPKEEFSHYIIPENSDWVFTGSTLAGILAESRKLRFCLFREGDSVDLPESSIIVVKDSGESSQNVDIRRIKASFEVSVNPEGVLGKSALSKREIQKGELLTGAPNEIASVLTRRLRRITSC